MYEIKSLHVLLVKWQGEKQERIRLQKGGSGVYKVDTLETAPDFMSKRMISPKSDRGLSSLIYLLMFVAERIRKRWTRVAYLLDFVRYGNTRRADGLLSSPNW